MTTLLKYSVFHPLIIFSFELQLTPSARGQRLGEFLMQLFERIGCYWKMDKMMLTVFKGNRRKNVYFLLLCVKCVVC